MKIRVDLPQAFFQTAHCPCCGGPLEQRQEAGELMDQWGCFKCERWIELPVQIELDAVTEGEPL